MVTTLSYYCRGHGFYSWLGNYDPCTEHGVAKKKRLILCFVNFTSIKKKNLSWLHVRSFNLHNLDFHYEIVSIFAKT